MLRIAGKFFYEHVTTDAPDIADDVVIAINGNRLKVDTDWRGPKNGAQRYQAVLEVPAVPVPLAHLKVSHDNTVKLRNLCDYTTVDSVVGAIVDEPGRSKAKP
jgi:hypothetical protein